MTHKQEELASFLKVYSSVPNAFIDELFSMYDLSTIQTDHVIDIDRVAKWLNVYKKNLIATMKSSYKENIDYIIHSNKKKPKTSKYGGNNYKQVLITPDCFKRLCMQTKSKRGEEVRTYFIELESLVVRYNQQLIASIKADEEQLRRNMRPRDLRDFAGYIYVIRASDKMDGVFKIGRSKDLNRRLNEYQTGRADAVEVIYKLRTENLKQVEGCVYSWLKEYKYDGCRIRCNEVYKADLDLIKLVINRCDDVGRAKMEYVRRKPLTMTGGYYFVFQKDPTTPNKYT